MFKDQKKELARLEEELLKDQELYDPALPEEFEEALPEEDLPEDFDFDGPEPDIWNADNTDEDPEEPKKPEKPENPDTGDAGDFLWLGMMLTGLFGFAATVTVWLRRRRTQH